ncbi:hypothetical protein VaNZ11_016671 [Volvox africanus]|uniref:Lipoxygenase n=1 Tax=Volvox africanus TaxID=51714 RepID=A0ABQ5SPQ9_9CHLO|nr:hypothetical protein VaNZ11_016671 [Volvox africanus]
MASVNSRTLNIADSLAGKRTKLLSASPAAGGLIRKRRSVSLRPHRTPLLQEKSSWNITTSAAAVEVGNIDTAPKASTGAGKGSSPEGVKIWKCSIRSTTPLLGDTGARLSLVVIDAHSELRSAVIDVDSWRPPKEITKSDGTHGWEREGAVSLPAAMKEPGAVLVRKQVENNRGASQDYIETITLVSTVSVHTVNANSWVSSDHNWRVFFSGFAYLPKDTPPTLADERRDELRAMQGTPETRVEERKETDRIYWFQTYNDLSSGKVDNKLVRPVLGNSKKLPYPRRLASNRGNEPDGREKAPRRGQQYWLQQDDEFSFDKKEDFQGNNIQGVLAGALSLVGEAASTTPSPITVLPATIWGLIRQVLGSILPTEAPLDNFESFKDVLALYKKAAGPNFRGLLPTNLYPAGSTASMDSDESMTERPSRFKTADGAWDFELSPEKAAEVDNFIAEQRVGPVYDSATGTPAKGTRSIFGVDSKPGASKTQERLGSKLWGVVKGQTPSVNNYFSFKVPRVIDGRPDAWHMDEEFGRQMVGGYNPMVITALKQLPESFGSAIRGEHVNADLQGSTLEELVSEAAAGGKPRLYYVDYWALSTFWETAAANNEVQKGKVQHAGRVVMYLRKDKDGNDTGLIPVAIELAHPDTHKEHPNLPHTAGLVYSRSKLSGDQGTLAVWRLAKMIFKSLDFSVHQLGSHWNRTHCVLEPFYISLRRQVSVMHPVYKLMAPHFRYTLQINRNARQQLINAGGIIERIVPSGKYAMLLASVLYGATWNFATEALPEDLKARGMVDPATGKPWLDYPYATDGLDIWSALTSYFDTYLRLYYKSDADVLEDPELQAWWNEAKTEGHPDLLKFGLRKDEKQLWGFTGPIPSVDKLGHVLATIAWLASGHHAAVNFGQYDYTSFLLNACSLTRRPIPAPGDAGWKELTSARPRLQERIILTYLSDPFTAVTVSSTVTLLSQHSRDEQTLDEVNELLVDPKARAANLAFMEEMKQLESRIEMRNTDVTSWARFGLTGDKGGPMPYTLLVPGSRAGLTMRGVPYSVSI